jgi:hypothetical protein
MKHLIAISSALALFSLNSCEKKEVMSQQVVSRHALEGGWLGDDGTVFLFKSDGTFHGYDMHNTEIWGNWVSLSDERIGFQSLMHNSYYAPQYAIVDTADNDQMDYIIAGGTSFIHAKRLSVDKAEAAIKTVVDPQIHHPKRASKDAGK